jgi:small subunit ribosomal protein S9
VTNLKNKIGFEIEVDGGGITGQAGAIKLAIARALVEYDPNLRPVLKNYGMLKRDPRMVERKKPGKPKARKSFQWTKR